MTSYVVLRKDITPANQPAAALVPWAAVDTVAATSADAAIRQVVEKSGENGQFVAVPARSWKPRKVTVETKKRTVLS
jgi:hypothetical protein